MSSHRMFGSSSASSSSSSSPSFFPRPVFASDLAAKKNSSKSTTTTPHRPSSSNSSRLPPPPSTSNPSQSMMDQLPAMQLPDFHLPDLNRLKQQLHKHTSFSLKSLQHTFHVPSYGGSSSSSTLTSTPSSSSIASGATSTIRSRLSLAGRPSRESSESTRGGVVTAEKPPLQQMQQQQPVSPSTTTTALSATAAPLSPIQYKPSVPVSIPTHPSNLLIKKQSTTTVDLSNIPDQTDIIEPAAATAPAPSTKSPVGHLFLQIVEARNLNLVNPPALSRPYCLVEYDQNELMTPSALPETDTMGRRGGNDIFARAMAASSPKWRHDAEFDVVRPNQQISITVYDSGAAEGHQEPARRFLGQVKLKPSEIHNRMIDSWFRLQGREVDEHEVTGEIRVTIKYQAIESRHLSTTDFDILRVLGVGSFGKVYQVRKKDTGRIYAMKVLVKKQVIEQKQVEHTIAERNVLVQALQSPFIVGLKFSFQTPTKLYLVQDFMNGGELFFHMQNEGTFSEARARFYAAELVLALEHLHSRHVVYRDLKPENVLLSSQGHIVLVDFGLCKQNVTEDERTHTFCGTTEYLAPEIVKGKGYGKAVDWWSLGVLLYEMLVGASPFEDSRTEGTYHKILHQPVIFPSRPVHSVKNGRHHHAPPPPTHHGASSAEAEFTSGTGISRNAQDIIQRFLDKNPKTRLGSGPNALAEIKGHPFFRGINFENLATRDVTPPFQPHVGVMGDLDVSNFDAHFTDQKTKNGEGDHGYDKAGHHRNRGSPSNGSTTVVIDGEAGSFLLQQQQRAANLYRQQQMRADNSTLNPIVLMRGRRSSNSWSSYRTPSNESIFSPSEPSSPLVNRNGVLRNNCKTKATVGSSSSPLRHPQDQRSPQHQQQQRQQEYFKGFTFEGESILETLKRQDDEQRLQSSLGDDEETERFVDGVRPDLPQDPIGLGFSGQHHRQQLFSGEATSVDSIFGSM
ncbi:hypothetical protein EMPS_11072 [Entomortierella parvispora]|uniref:non-specific serine/threonine protein kinase n=1 Tax=Entomortierella parvispora TaxID=205924 RepID=A0A9P3M1W0_9FUNG|nr:hypothetical protein EMPS_11072 [Entomortierella parvispora]